MLTQYPNSDILVTGHSLGGALAGVAALELKQSPIYNVHAIKSVSVITFGQPRWCNKNLALYFDKIIDSNWRIVNEHDVVSTLPYESLGYYHTSTQIWYTSTDPLEYKQCDGSGEDWDCSYLGYSVEDHLNYFGLYEDCPQPVNETNIIDSISSTMPPSDLHILDCDCDEVMFQSTLLNVAESVDDSSDTLYVILLSIAVISGWIFAIVFGCCWCKTRRLFNEYQQKSSYFQLHDAV